MTSATLSKILSYLFHPLLIPIYLLIILLNTYTLSPYSLSCYLQLTLIGITIFTAIVSPLLIVYLLLRFKIITSIYTETKEERVYPILTVAAFYYLTYILLKGFQVSAIFSYYMLGSTLLAIVVLFINFYKKISLHMVGMGSAIGLFSGLIYRFQIDFAMLIIVGILLSGLVGYARLESKSHHPAEIYAGFLLGLIVMTLLFAIL